MTLNHCLILPLLGVLLCAPTILSAQEDDESREENLPQGTIYYWHDEGGQLHATDDLSSVPEAHQGAAKARAGRLPGGESTTIETKKSAWQPPPERSKKQGDPQGDKAHWQEMIQAEKDAKSQAQSRLEEIDEQLLRVKSTRPPGFHQTLADLNEEKESLRAEIKRANYELETGIPEKARKAGVPPGWLR